MKIKSYIQIYSIGCEKNIIRSNFNALIQLKMKTWFFITTWEENT